MLPLVMLVADLAARRQMTTSAVDLALLDDDRVCWLACRQPWPAGGRVWPGGVWCVRPLQPALSAPLLIVLKTLLH